MLKSLSGHGDFFFMALGIEPNIDTTTGAKGPLLSTHLNLSNIPEPNLDPCLKACYTQAEVRKAMTPKPALEN